MYLSNSKIKLFVSILWWFLTLATYHAIRFSSGLEKINSAKNTSEMTFVIIFGCILFGISSWIISKVVDKYKLIHSNFIVQIAFKTISLFFILVFFIFSIIIFKDFGSLQEDAYSFSIILDILSTPLLKSIFIYFTFSSILLNLFFISLDIVGVEHTLRLLIGNFKVPKNEKRLFLFIDLKDSTSITERIGHKKYSLLMREVYSIINDVCYKYYGEIYQYIGDEVIISWPTKNIESSDQAIKTYLEVKKEIQNRSEKFNETFGFIPEFWAGATSGEVTVVEIGTFKRHITYFGDALNMASRLTSLCKDVKTDFLVTTNLIQESMEISSKDYGEFDLRGFSYKVKVSSPFYK